MIRTAVDTSLLVAVVLPWHKSHRIAFSALEAILIDEGAILVPLPAVLEAYAVLTRLPAPHWMSPQDACSTLNWRDFERLRPKGLRVERPLS